MVYVVTPSARVITVSWNRLALKRRGGWTVTLVMGPLEWSSIRFSMPRSRDTVDGKEISIGVLKSLLKEPSMGSPNPLKTEV